MRLRHSDDTLLEGFVSCKSPIAAPIGSHRITYWAWTYRRRQRCVTNVVKLEHFEALCEDPCYKRRQSEAKNHYFSQKCRRIDDVCNNTRRTRQQRPGTTGAEGAGGTGRLGCGARGQRRGLARLRDETQSHTSAPQPHWCGGRRRDRRAWLRCPWAAAGPGRASRRRAERSSRRGRRAGGPPPTGTQSSPASAADQPRISQHSTSRRRGRPRQ